jgi:LuxR family transcriptional regulator, maltose regulon positive regulatory protein
MAHTTPTLDNGALEWQADGRLQRVQIDTPAWFRWLEQGITFALHTPAGNITVRCDKGQRGGYYWRAYRRSGGVLRQVYLGKAEALSEERLLAAAAKLGSDSPATLLPSSCARPEPVASPHATAVLRPVLQARLRPPAGSDITLARPTTLAQLSASIEQQRLTLLCAPVAFGKTVLLRQWAQQAGQQRQAYAWLTLEEGDNEPMRFWAALLAALEAVYPGFGEAARGQLAQPYHHTSVDMLTQLLNDLQAIPHRLTMVLDEYHLIDQRSIHASMATFIGGLPRHVHLVVSSRSEPPWPVQRWRMAGVVAILRASDLCLSQGECVALARSLAGEVPAATLDWLADVSEGWVGGLQLAALTLREQHQITSLSALVHTPYQLAAFLSAEVWERLPQSAQELLLATTFLDQLYGPLCDAISKKNGSALLLEQLAEAQLLLVRLENKPGWYRLHHLLRPWLQERSAPQPADYEAAATWFAGQGRLAEAISYALKGECFAAASQLLANHGEHWLLRGELHTLRSWLDRLPPTLLASQPRLLFIHLQTLMLERRWECIEPQLRALPPLDRPAPHGAWALLHGLAALVGGQIALAERVLATAQAALPPDDHFLQSMHQLLWGALAWAQGDQGLAQQQFAAVGSSALAHNGQQIALLALAHQGHFHAIAGQLDLALICYEQVLAQTQARNAGATLVRGMALLGSAQICFERNELPRAAQMVQQALAIAEQAADDEFHGAATLLRCQIALAGGDTFQATQLLAGLEHSLRQGATSQIGLLHLALGRAELALASAEPTVAASWLNGVSHIVEQLVPSTLAWKAQLLHARVLLAQGALHQVGQLLETLHARAAQTRRTGSLVAVLALQASLADAQGGRQRAQRLLVEALEQGAAGRYMQSLLLAGPALGPLLEALEPTSPFQSYRAMLRTALARPQRQLTAPSGAPPLSEREWAVLRLLARGASNSEIAQQLVVTVGTVKKHLSSIYQKLGVARRTQAIAAAQQQGLLERQPPRNPSYG